MRQYPRDPRAHLYQAMALVQARNLQGAEQQMRLALSEPDIFTLLVPTAKPHLQSYLALILTDLRAAPPALLERCMGRLEAKSFLEWHSSQDLPAAV